MITTFINNWSGTEEFIAIEISYGYIEKRFIFTFVLFGFGVVVCFN
jgi:hypothetical protein